MNVQQRMEAGNVCDIRFIEDTHSSSLQIANNRLFGKAPHGDTIKMWNLLDGLFIRTFEHNAPIEHYVATDMDLYCASKGNLKKWSLAEEGQSELTRDNTNVTCLIYQLGYLFLGAGEGSITQYNTDLAMIRVFKNHTTPISSLCAAEGHLYSATTRGTVIKWSLGSEGNEIKIKAHEGEISSLLVSGQHLFTASKTDLTVKMWDAECGWEHTFDLGGKWPRLEVEGDFLTASAGDSDRGPAAIRKWNIQTRELVSEIKACNWYSFSTEAADFPQFIKTRRYPNSDEAVVSSDRFASSFVTAGSKVYMTHRSTPHLTIADLETGQKIATLSDQRIIPFDSLRNPFHYLLGESSCGTGDIVKGNGYICLNEGNRITLLDFHETGENPAVKAVKRAALEVGFLAANGFSRVWNSLKIPAGGGRGYGQGLAGSI